MKIYAISDLHLSGACDKPMDIFGAQWNDHWNRIKSNWQDSGITDDDAVVVAGDISWAMRLDEALVDLFEIAALPGKKFLIRGNHDYWWSSVSRIRSSLPKDVFVLQNDSVRLGDYVFCGNRGWVVPGSSTFKQEDQKLYDRELLRTELALKSAKQAGGDIVAMIHYPPFDERQRPSGFTELYEAYGAKLVAYGHLHGKSCAAAFSGTINGVEYVLTSCDHLELKPVLLRG